MYCTFPASNTKSPNGATVRELRNTPGKTPDQMQHIFRHKWDTTESCRQRVTPGGFELLTKRLSDGVRGHVAQHTLVSEDSGRQQRCWLEATQEAAAHRLLVLLLSGIGVIRKHPAQTDRLRGNHQVRDVILTVGQVSEPVQPNYKYFLKAFKPLTNGSTTLSHDTFSKLQRHGVLGDAALCILLSCLVDN